MTHGLRAWLAAASLGALMCRSGVVAAMTLLQAYEAALQNDPVYRAAVHENEAGRQYAALGRAYLLPQVSINYSANKNRVDVVAPDMSGNRVRTPLDYRSSTGALSLRQPILNLEALARYNQGVAQSNASDARFSGHRQELMLRLLAAYADAQYADDQVTLASAQRDAFAEQRRVNDRMHQRGEASKTDMLETQAKLDMAEAQLIEAHDNLANARNALSAIVGGDAVPLQALADDFRVRPMRPASFEEWREIALKNNAEIAAQHHAVEAARQEVGRSRAGHVPRLDLVASVGRNSSETLSTLNQDATVRSVGVQLVVPIFSGGAVSAATEQAVANLDKARAELDAATSKVLVELRKQYRLTLSAAARLDALVKSAESTRMAVQATQQGVKAGVRINLDVLNAQQQRIAALRDLAQARYSYLLSYLRLRLTAGILSVDDLREVATYFASR